MVSSPQAPISSPGDDVAAGPRFLVVGAGAIGGTIAAHLIELGLDVTVLTTNTTIASAINARGFRLRGETGANMVTGSALTELPPTVEPFDYILLTTQPPQVEEAAIGSARALAPNGVMVCFQNGLCEERVAQIIGTDRVVGAIVAWGASMLEPGVYDRTSSGGFSIGRLNGRMDAKVDELCRVLEIIGPTIATQNLIGARWSKLAINCAISSLGTVGGDRLGPLIRHRFVRRLALEIFTECVDVAKAAGVRLEKVAGTVDLEWLALSEADKVANASSTLVAKHALLLAVGARYRRLRSSMLAAIERGRPPAVRFLNGEIVDRGQKLGISTPINEGIQEQVLEIARGAATPGLSLLRRFFDETRRPR